MSFESRGHIRRPVHIPAKLFVGSDVPQHDCVLLDVSDSGARLETGAAADLPDQFIIILTARGTPYRLCNVVWRGKDQMAVAFDPTRSSHTHIDR